MYDSNRGFEIIARQQVMGKLSSEQIYQINSSSSSLEFLHALLELNKVGYLDLSSANNYINKVLKHEDPHGLAIVFNNLHSKFIPGLTNAHWLDGFFEIVFEIILTTKSPAVSLNIIQQMHVYNLLKDLSSGYQDFIFLSQRPSKLAVNICALGILQCSGVLLQPNAQMYRNVVYEHSKPLAAAEDLVRLNLLGMLRKEKDFNFVRRAKNPGDISKLLVKMKSVGLIYDREITKYYFLEVTKRGRFRLIKEAFKEFEKLGFLNDIEFARSAFARVVKCDSPVVSAVYLGVARDFGLFLPSNSKAKINLFYAKRMLDTPIFIVMSDLRRRGFFINLDSVQIIFDNLCQYSVILLLNAFINTQMNRIPAEAEFNFQHWQFIIEICRENLYLEPVVIQQIVAAYINENIIVPYHTQKNNSVYLDLQNTHKASVHLCSSQSALRLDGHYRHKIAGAKYGRAFGGLFKFVHNTSQYLNKTEYPNIENPYWIPWAAKLFLLGLDTLSIEPDPVSSIYLNRLVVLIWVAIHDHAKRTANIKDAKNKLLEAMFEAMRNGNNISNNNNCFIDDGLYNAPACLSGAFNKFIEKLVSIHPDIIWMFITQEGATDKFVQEIPLQIHSYLRAAGIQKKEDLPSIDSIIEVVKQRIKIRLFFEYGSLYIKKHEELELFNKTLINYNCLEDLQANHADYDIFIHLLESNQVQEFTGIVDSIEYYPIDNDIDCYFAGLEVEEEELSTSFGCT